MAGRRSDNSRSLKDSGLTCAARILDCAADLRSRLRAVLIEYQVHYNSARPHQGIVQRVPGCDREVPGVTAVNLDARRIRRKPVLNGLINEYSRAA
jgi:hypothetical protein